MLILYIQILNIAIYFISFNIIINEILAIDSA